MVAQDEEDEDQQTLERNCSRNRALEEVARNFFPPNTTTDL